MSQIEVAEPFAPVESVPDSFLSGEDIEGDGGDWYALYTRSRFEKRVADQLRDKAVEHLLPLYDVHSQWKDRKKWVRKPLFPGYLFVYTRDEADLAAAWHTRGVVHVVSTGNGPVPVPDEQVEAVRRMVESPVDIDPWPYLKSGRRVRVQAGPLAGLEGFVSSRKGIHRVVITVDLLGRGVAAEISPDHLEPI